LRRGELYRVFKPHSRETKLHRIFVIVSRQVLIASKFSTVICAPIYSAYHGLSTQVPLGIEDGMKQECCVHCDELISLPKSNLTQFISSLRPIKLRLLDRALASALEIQVENLATE